MQTSISKHPAPEDSDRVPSMEGNQAIQGFTAGIVEMLLQSHAGEIELLPALPKAWPTGTMRGLRARGGYDVDLSWRMGRLDSATLYPKFAGPCRVRVAGGSEILTGGKIVPVRKIAPDVVEFDAVPGTVYTVRPQS
jgi:alpha-L-fucosidase 2